jgi:hypothetical protein
LAEKSGIAISNVPFKVIGVEDQKARLLMLGLAQQHVGSVATAKAAYQELKQECQRELEKTAFDSSPGAEVHAWLGHAYAGLGDAAAAIRERFPRVS